MLPADKFSIEDIERDNEEIDYLSVDELKKTLCGFIDDSMKRLGNENKTGISKSDDGKFMFCIEDVVMTNKDRDNNEVLTYYCEIESSL